MAYWRRGPNKCRRRPNRSRWRRLRLGRRRQAAKSPRSRHDAPVRSGRAGAAYDPGADEALLNKAYVYAMTAHGKQTRASGDPYFAHPLEVAAILTDLKLDVATIVTALLHDTIEDTVVTRDEIEDVFGDEIANLVDGVTKLNQLELFSREAKQAENLRKLMLAIADDVRVLLVKLADRLHNMRTLEFVPQDKRRRIAEETLDIYAPLAGRMGMQKMREELEDLSFHTLDPEAYAIVHAAAGCGGRAQPQPDRRDRKPAVQEPAEERHRGAGLWPPQAAVFDLDARWSASRSASNSFPTSSASAS